MTNTFTIIVNESDIKELLMIVRSSIIDPYNPDKLSESLYTQLGNIYLSIKDKEIKKGESI